MQSNILNYELAVDLLVNMPDAEVLDVFARLNSYALVLNEQEKLNARYFGPFKHLAEKLGHNYNSFWTRNKILTTQQILRMGDVTLVSDILIAIIEGIKSKKQIKVFFALYEKDFPHDEEQLEMNFVQIMDMIQAVFRDNLRDTEFRRNHLFYTLFTAFYHLQFGIKNISKPCVRVEPRDFPKLASKLERVNAIFAAHDIRELSKNEVQFLQDCRRATTDGPVRTRRTEFVLKLIEI